MNRRLLPLLLTLLAFFGAGLETLQAQIEVQLSFKRRLYITYEPVIATISIRNLSGRDLPLSDAPSNQWFTFQVNREDGFPVRPYNPDYVLSPIIIPAGETISRTVNLTDLYPITEYGRYRVRAAIYFTPERKYFQSAMRSIEITEGKTIWQQTVGVPDGQEGAGGTRVYTLLEFRRSEFNYLYVRVVDPNASVVYRSTSLGKLLGHEPPQVDLDISNTLHVLQVVGPKTYRHNQIGLNGEIIGAETYVAAKSRPRLQRDVTGTIAIRGGMVQSATTNQQLGVGSAEQRGVPKLSDRPPNLPRE